MRRIGIDTGGTFTDLLLLEDGVLHAVKVASTPEDPSAAVMEGLVRLGQAGEIIHGSTVGTNALLERSGARTALVTTKGFADVLEIGRQARPHLYQLEPRREAPVIPAELRFEVEERLAADGTILQAPDPAQWSRLVADLRAAGVESVAVGLLHSYRNPCHEIAVGEALKELGVPVSLSHQVLGEYREFERFSAVAVNAYIRPRMEAYLTRLQDAVPGRLRVMRSNGGCLSAAAAGAQPVQTILSGPAGGVMAAAFLGRQVGEERIITFDMGGTSTDVSLLDGPPGLSADLAVGEIPLRIPALDIHTVGAGGGSVAWRDSGGALRVGPRSAGAEPGPACYGKGEEVTVTDANLLMGRLLPDHFLGGEMPLDTRRARACLELLAAELSLEPGQAAAGVLQVAQATMEEAIRVISLARGHDPSRFVLYSYGGAGGLHVVALARNLGIPRVRIPRHPGLFSALGMLASDVIVDLSETVLVGAEPAQRPRLEAAYGALEQRALDLLQEEGFPTDRVELLRSADVRYHGQSYELNVPYGDDMAAAFHQAHERRYGHARRDRPLQVVHLRVRALGRVESPRLAELEPGGGAAEDAACGQRSVLLDDGREVQAVVLQRERLQPDVAFRGPAVVVEYSSTVWLPPGTQGSVDRWGSLLLEVGG